MNPALLRDSLNVQSTIDYYIEYVFGYYIYILKKVDEKETFDKTKMQDNSFSNSINDKFEKPYKNSWFSPDAHNNYKILVKEYHKLAVKYHPDNNSSVKIFLDIQEEKAKITEGLK